VSIPFDDSTDTQQVISGTSRSRQSLAPVFTNHNANVFCDARQCLLIRWTCNDGALPRGLLWLRSRVKYSDAVVTVCECS